MQWMGYGDAFNAEPIKHMLRQGKACIVWTKNAAHGEVVVGFETKADGTTTWEPLNSNRIEVDKGYRTTQEKIAPEFSVWFE